MKCRRKALDWLSQGEEGQTESLAQMGNAILEPQKNGIFQLPKNKLPKKNSILKESTALTSFDLGLASTFGNFLSSPLVMPASSQDGRSVQPVPSLRPMCGDGTERVGPSVHPWGQPRGKNRQKSHRECLLEAHHQGGSKSSKEARAGLHTE